MRRGDLAFSLLNAVLGFDLFLFSNLVIGFFVVEVSRYFFRYVSLSGKRNGAWSFMA